jgi:hypothetical protein
MGGIQFEPGVFKSFDSCVLAGRQVSAAIGANLPALDVYQGQIAFPKEIAWIPGN